MASFQEAFQYAQKNPDSDFAKGFAQHVVSGAADQDLKNAGIDGNQLKPLLKQKYELQDTTPTQPVATTQESKKRNGLQKTLGAFLDPIIEGAAYTGEAVGSLGFKALNKLTGGAIDRYAKAHGGAGVDEGIDKTINESAQVPFLGTEIGPANELTAENIAGRAVSTVGLGLGSPVVAGAALGAGNALEEGRTAGGVAIQTITGALGGKILEHGFNAVSPYVEKAILKYGTPLYEKLATYIPEGMKDTFKAMADKVGNAVEKITPDVADKKVLPQGVSDVINKGATVVDNVVDKGANAVVDGTKAVVKKVKTGIAPEPTPIKAAGQITQGETGDLTKSMRAFTNIDTKDVKTYEDLSNRLKDKVPDLAKTVDTELAKDSTKYSLKDLQKVDKSNSGAEVRTDYVESALKHLSELYEQTGDAVAKANVDELLGVAKKEGLTRQEVNNISRQYGQEFGSKAFSKMGDPLTSVNAQKFENVRSGLKDVARQGIGGAEAKAADKTLSSIYRTIDLVEKQKEAVNKLRQRIEERGWISKFAYKTVKTINTVSGGALRGITDAVLNRGTGLKTLNALDLESVLERNLDIIRKATEAGTPKEAEKLIDSLSSKKK